jgi:cytochrome c-type biogenesis protein
MMPFLAQLAPAAEGIEAALRTQPLLSIGLLFGAGVMTSLTPCIYPMIPVTVGLLSGSGAEQSRRRTALLTLTYMAGLASVYAALGLLAGLTGSIFGAVSASPWAYFITANLLLLFGLAFLDVFSIALPPGLAGWAARFDARSYPGALAMGATSGLVAAPCGAPAFGTVLTFVGLTGNAVLGFVYLFAFSLGMTAVLGVVGLASGRLAALPRSGRWMIAVKRAGAVLLLLMAEYYFVQTGKVL